jgi:hypothetical protein
MKKSNLCRYSLCISVFSYETHSIRVVNTEDLCFNIIKILCNKNEKRCVYLEKQKALCYLMRPIHLV